MIARETRLIRTPDAIRPWQHVLEPLSGYLKVAEHCWQGQPLPEGWNFGPGPKSEVTVGEVADHLVRRWGAQGRIGTATAANIPMKPRYLRLDCTKANTELGWHPVLPLEQALDLTVEWYKHFNDGASMRDVTIAQINRVLETPSRSETPLRPS